MMAIYDVRDDDVRIIMETTTTRGDHWSDFIIPRECVSAAALRVSSTSSTTRQHNECVRLLLVGQTICLVHLCTLSLFHILYILWVYVSIVLLRGRAETRACRAQQKERDGNYINLIYVCGVCVCAAAMS